MKKALITTLSALLLFLGLAALVNVSAEKRQNNIEYRLEIITGDSELLNGINITLTAFMNDDYSNSFRLPRDVFYWKSQLRINDGQVSSDDLFAKVEDDFMLPAPDLHIKLLEDLSLTKPVYDFRLAQWPNNIGVEGQSCSVKMNEIFDYYPLSLYCISEDITYGCTYDKYEIYAEEYDSTNKISAISRYNLEKLQDFFKVPVFENEIIKVPREQYSWCERTSKNRYDFNSIIEKGDSAYYIAISSHTSLGNQVDTSRIPGGYGIYKLPYAYVNAKNYKGMEEYSDYDILTDDISLLTPIDPSFFIKSIDYDSVSKTLFVLVEETDDLKVYAIDETSGEIFEKITLEASFTDDLRIRSSVGNGFVFYNFRDYKLLVVGKNSDGNYDKLIETTYSSDINWDYLYIGHSKGDMKLIKFRSLSKDGKYYLFSQDTQNAVNVFVISDKGVEYSGVIHSSLDDAYQNTVTKKYYISPRSYFSNVSWE